MRLSEAIRLGALITAPGVRVFVQKQEKACALGAAAIAAGTSPDLYGLMRYFGWAASTEASCPACDVRRTVLELVIHLNDCHNMPREEIGCWVATVEAPTTSTARSDDDAQGTGMAASLG